MADFTHFTQDGRPQMVNVGEKDETQRIAIATGKVLVGKATLSAIAEGGLKKGDVYLVDSGGQYKVKIHWFSD